MTEPSEAAAVRALRGPAFRADPTHQYVQDERWQRAVSLLREIPLFREVPPHHLGALAQLAHVETFSAGEVIIRMGEVGSTMYVIRSGRVQVVRERPGAEALVFATLGPGDVFGELSIFDSEERSATVVAVEDTDTVTLGRVDIVRLVSRSPEMALSLLKALSARLRVANDRLTHAPPAP